MASNKGVLENIYKYSAITSYFLLGLCQGPLIL